jgi:hypothetical protein
MEPLQADWLQSAQETRRQGTRGLLADTPRSRRSDPETSHEAAEGVRRSGELGRQQLAVLAAVQRWPGLTSLELGARMEINRWAVARRLPELEPVHVRKGEPRVVNGRRHVTWFPVEVRP